MYGEESLLLFERPSCRCLLLIELQSAMPLPDMNPVYLQPLPSSSQRLTAYDLLHLDGGGEGHCCCGDSYS